MWKSVAVTPGGVCELVLVFVAGTPGGVCELVLVFVAGTPGGVYLFLCL